MFLVQDFTRTWTCSGVFVDLNGVLVYNDVLNYTLVLVFGCICQSTEEESAEDMNLTSFLF